MKKIISIFAVSILLFAAGCGTESPNEGIEEPIEEITEPGEPLSFTMEEIAKHNMTNDCWLLIDGKIYDVAGFVNKHPGGEAILEGCGKDATELFETRPMGSGTPHSDQAREGMEKFYLGELAD